MAAAVLGRLEWSSQATREGHRTHKIKWLVQSAYADGPYDIYFATGLPQVGSTWVYGTVNDLWAFCEPDWVITPVLNNEPNDLWTVEQKFSTLPRKRCQDDSIENPLDEPDRISGTFVKYTEKTEIDANGNPITNSSMQTIPVERDSNRPAVTIEKNVLDLELDLFSPMVDTLNDATLWGLGPRKIKLSNVSWQRLLYGTCSYYYSISYEFDVQYNGFDKKILDIGNRVLKDPGADPADPSSYVDYVDAHGNNTIIPLKDGQKWDGTGNQPEIDVERYPESNFLLLGIPTSL